MRDLAHLVQRLLDAVADRVQLAHHHGVISSEIARCPEMHPDRDEPLLDAVVQVAFEPPAFIVARADDAGARLPELVHRVAPPRVELRVLGGEERDGTRSLEQLGVVVELRIVEDRDGGRPVACHDGESAPSQHPEIEPPAPTCGSTSTMIVAGTAAAKNATAMISLGIRPSKRPVGNVRISSSVAR